MNMPNLQSVSYPTKDEILNSLLPVDSNTIAALRDWMATTWKEAKRKGEEDKFLALVGLINAINGLYNGNEVTVQYKPHIPSCCYITIKKTIYLNNSLSIISSLHELGHHLFGNSELKACVWSVSLFKAAFPKAYSKLTWKGHLLIKA